MDTYLKRYTWIIHLLLIATVGHSASMLVNHLLIGEAQSKLQQLASAQQPKAKKRVRVSKTTTKRWAKMISDRNLFNANPPGPEENKPKDESTDEEDPTKLGQIPGPNDECESSKISATVKMNVVAEPIEASYTMININNEDRIYKLHDTIEEQEIVAIQWSGRNRRVVLSNQGKFECLDLGKKNQKKRGRYTPPKRGRAKKSNKKNNDFKKYVKEISPGRFEVDRAMLDEQLADLDNLVRQARVIPHYKRGKPAGFKVVGIRSNSLFRHLGLKTGDVLKSVGGEELTSINKALSLFDKLKSSDNLSLDFERRGKVNSHEYNIK